VVGHIVIVLGVLGSFQGERLWHAISTLRPAAGLVDKRC
jgi:hypothetical protein